jgi:hypothetical protein
MNRRLKRFLIGIRGPLLPIPGAHSRLTSCDACGSRIVNPVAWHEHDESHRWVRLRCGACAWSREVIITDADAKHLELDLAEGLEEIATTVARLDRERMIREAEVFIAALRRDLIGPADFARHLPR